MGKLKFGGIERLCEIIFWLFVTQFQKWFLSRNGVTYDLILFTFDFSYPTGQAGIFYFASPPTPNPLLPSHSSPVF